MSDGHVVISFVREVCTGAPSPYGIQEVGYEISRQAFGSLE